MPQYGEIVIFLLLLFIMVREALYTHQTNKLVNKLMSRNYNDYVFTNNVTKNAPSQEGTKLKMDTELPEDLSPIQGFGVN